LQRTLDEAGVPDLATPDRRSLFAATLIEKGGVLEAVGRAIRVQALLQGATEIKATRRPAKEPIV
jgi:hypothetical protein